MHQIKLSFKHKKTSPTKVRKGLIYGNIKLTFLRMNSYILYIFYQIYLYFFFSFGTISGNAFDNAILCSNRLLVLGFSIES